MHTAIVSTSCQSDQMYSKIPKVFHNIAGVPMIKHVFSNIELVGINQKTVLGDKQTQPFRDHLPDVKWFFSQEDLFAEKFEDLVLVTYGNYPLIDCETYKSLLDYHKSKQATLTVLSFAEFADTGIYCIDNKALTEYLQKALPGNRELNDCVTNLIEHFVNEGSLINDYRGGDPQEYLRINNRVQLAQAEKIIRDRIREKWMLAGVTMIDPDSTFIDGNCEIGNDTILYPGVYLQNDTRIGQNCVIGPNVRLNQTTIGNNVIIDNSVMLEASIGDNTQVGPFAYIRPGTEIANGCKIGDFVEVKNSTVGSGSKIPHHAYVGDSDVGTSVNFGCGSITCNYDGRQKNRTKVGDNVFIGSNSSLVAPINIKDGAYIAAGSTITKDVTENSLAIGRSRQINKEGWVSKKKED